MIQVVWRNPKIHYKFLRASDENSWRLLLRATTVSTNTLALCYEEQNNYDTKFFGKQTVILNKKGKQRYPIFIIDSVSGWHNLQEIVVIADSRGLLWQVCWLFFSWAGKPTHRIDMNIKTHAVVVRVVISNEGDTLKKLLSYHAVK